VGGCASVISGDMQAVTIATYDPSGTPIAGVDCKLSNNNGAWQVRSPGTVNVRKSAQELLVRCEMEDNPPGVTKVASSANAAIFGNVVFGGVVGVIVDQSTGSGYDYPTHVRVDLGKTRFASGSAAATSSPAPSLAPPSVAAPSRKVNMDDLEGLLGAR
jgi:hypothetical protein